MKLAYLTEVAAIMAAHSQLFIEQPDEISAEAVGDYYVLSRNRFNRWMRELDGSGHVQPISDTQQLMGRSPCRPATRAITEQILIHEMISRIWTVMLLARDVSNGIDRIQPVARNIYLGHQAVRHKALGAVLADDRLSSKDLLAIDQLRKSSERWTDLLCCAMIGQYNLWEFAFDKDRAREFLRDRVDQAGLSHRSRSWVLILAGLRHSFPDTEALSAPVHDDDRRLVRLILNSFPANIHEMAFWMGSRVREARPC